MRRYPVALLLSGVVVATSACAVDATAPASFAAPESAVMAKGEQKGEWLDWRGNGGSGTSYTVTIDLRRRNVLRFGQYALDIPEHAVCRRDTSAYRTVRFDEECRSAKGRLTITAKVHSTVSGYPHIELQPEMRFDPRKTVTLSVEMPHLASLSPDWRILYCPTRLLSGCVDEALLDPSLATRVDDTTGTLFRRIKHFSGYYVSE